jgi:hypothetical protein
MPGRKTRRWAMVRTRPDGLTHHMPEYGARFEPSVVPGDMLDCVVPVVVVVAITSDVDWHRGRLSYKDSGNAFGICRTEEGIN